MSGMVCFFCTYHSLRKNKASLRYEHEYEVSDSISKQLEIIKMTFTNTFFLNIKFSFLTRIATKITQMGPLFFVNVSQMCPQKPHLLERSTANFALAGDFFARRIRFSEMNFLVRFQIFHTLESFAAEIAQERPLRFVRRLVSREFGLGVGSKRVALVAGFEANVDFVSPP